MKDLKMKEGKNMNGAGGLLYRGLERQKLIQDTHPYFWELVVQS